MAEPDYSGWTGNQQTDSGGYSGTPAPTYKPAQGEWVGGSAYTPQQLQEIERTGYLPGYGPGTSSSNQSTTQSQSDKWYGDISTAINSLGNYAKNQIFSPVYAAPDSSGLNNISQSSQKPQGIPSNYTGYSGGNAYVGGTVQTSGGGFTPDGSYSAGYHGGGGGFFEDRGQWGTGMNMGPMINGTVQTGGGGFTPDGSYSAGYHGSGEHPEITGESTPGQYQSGSFGSVLNPDFSNFGKAGDWIRYVESMGYDVSGLDKYKLERQYYDNNDKFDALGLLKTLPQANQSKTDMFSQLAGNPMMPTSQVQDLLGGSGYSNLFAPASYAQYVTLLNKMFNLGQPNQQAPEIVNQKVKSLQDIPAAIQNQLFSNYITPYATNYYSNDKEKLKSLFNL